MAVLIGSIDPRFTVKSSGNLDIEGARDVNALTIGSNTYVYVTGLQGDTVSGFHLTSDGKLTSTFNLADNDTLELAGAASFASTTIGGSTFLYVNGFDDDGVSGFRVNDADGSLTNIVNIDDTDNTLRLNGSRGQMTVADVGGQKFLVATAYYDDGFTVFQIDNNGGLTKTAIAYDLQNINYELNQARDVTSATVDGHTFLFVTGYADDGVSSFELMADGTVSFRDSVDDAESGALNLDGAYGVTTAVVGGTTYLVASGEQDDGLSVFSVNGAGQLNNVFNLEDSGARGLDSPRGVSTFTLQGETFILVSAATDKALNVFHMSANGSLTDVTRVFDTPDIALGGARYNYFTMVNGVPLILGTGQSDSGVSTFELGGAADKIKGGAAADLILGLAGNDNLNGSGGKDKIFGGLGNDKIAGGKAADILEGGGGKDTFIFTKVKDSGPSGSKRDHIADFTGKDFIDLHKIDADTTLKGNQDFSIDHGGGFDAGEIALHKTKAGLLLLVNTDDDAKAEMTILLDDFKGKIHDNDFIF